jgi:uncharacterized protein (DUF2141 family)
MKTYRLLFLLSLFLVSTGSTAQNLTVVVKGVKNSKGMVRVAIYNSEKDYMKTMWRSAGVQAAMGEVQIVFENIPPGNYALSIVHDTNMNDKMDTNAMGIPKEGFGFSNNVRGAFGPPTFAEARWEWDGLQKAEISLYYY